MEPFNEDDIKTMLSEFKNKIKEIKREETWQYFENKIKIAKVFHYSCWRRKYIHTRNFPN